MREWGDPPPGVAVIHGGPGAPGSIAPVALELSSEFGVLEPLQSADSVDGQVDELKSQLEAEADLPVVLIGHSWGAWLAWILAARHPQMVSKLILVGSGPFEARYADEIKETRLSRVVAEEREEARALMRDLDDPAVPDKCRLMERLGHLLGRTDAFDPLPHENPDALDFQGEVNLKVWADAKALRESGEILEMAKRIRRPVVAIHGDYDPHPAEGVKKPLSAALSDFRFILLRNCGHEPWIERRARDEFFRVLRRELR